MSKYIAMHYQTRSDDRLPLDQKQIQSKRKMYTDHKRPYSIVCRFRLGLWWLLYSGFAYV